MRRILVSLLVVVGLALAIGLQGAGAASTVPFTTKLLGAQVSSNENVYDIRGTPRGAGIQIFKNNAKLTKGTDTFTGYYGTGIVVGKDSYTLSKVSAKGIITIKGSGSFVRGTGSYKGVKGSYKYTGTENVKTRVIKITIKGTISL